MLGSLMFEAEKKRDKDVKLQLMQRATAVKKPIAKPVSNLDLKRNELCELRSKKNALHRELATEKQIDLETQRSENARLELSLINARAERKKEQEAYNRKMALESARPCPEAATFWRELAQAEFSAKKL
jgi:hypothetical protein